VVVVVASNGYVVTARPLGVEEQAGLQQGGR
jgi:hypothetical protein